MEAHGGHYGPEFVTFFDEQNAKILKGSLKGELINVSALVINKCVPRPSFPISSLDNAPPCLVADGTTHSSKIKLTSTLRQTRLGMGSCRATTSSQR